MKRSSVWMLFMSIGCALYEFVEENGIKVHSEIKNTV